MKLLIDIPEEYYKTLHNIPDAISTADMLLIKYGTPLPEHHGRLIDADKLKKQAVFMDTARLIDNAPTVLEATKEGDGE